MSRSLKKGPFTDAKLLKKVGKLKVGEKITLCDGRLNEGLAEIKSYGKNFFEICTSQFFSNSTFFSFSKNNLNPDIIKNRPKI